MSEIKRIQDVYSKRKEDRSKDLYSFFNVSNLFMVQSRESAFLNFLKKYNINSLHEKTILDIGCGKGTELINLLRYGAQPANLFGIELLQDRIETAKKTHPHIHFNCGDASNLPFEDGQFNLIIQFTVFTSILDNEMKKAIAQEMIRVLKPNGLVVWFDFHMNNPVNPDVRGVKKKEIKELFPDCNIDLKKILLAPPITRLIAPHSWLICYLLEKLKLLNTHYIGVITKPS